jgi:hypothetical protein
MVWIIEIGILLMVAVVLRHVLHMGQNSTSQQVTPRFRRPRNNPACSPLASEIEAHTTILGVMLNDVITEQNSGNEEIARTMLSLFDSERERLVELVISLQNLSLKYLPAVQYPLDPRTLDHGGFLSQPVREFVARHGVLEQFVFRSKLRFQLQLRLLRRATALLNESFEVVKHDLGADSRLFDGALTQLDLYFHDLDLLTKETLLGFSAELASLPDTVMEDMVAELSTLTTRSSVLSTFATSAQR